MIEEDAMRELISFVFKALSDGLTANYTYHSPTHVCMVYRDSSFLADKLNISEEDLQLLQTAAAMHDYGFLKGHTNHEQIGCEEARELLPKYGFNDKQIEIICAMIMSTKIPQSPKTLLEKILCDADLFYLGSNYYFEIAGQFKKELQSLNILESEEQWRKIQIGFLETHKYHLECSQELLDKTKAENLRFLKSSE